MQLNLQRPLIVFDIETTGLNITQDHIIELSYVKVYPDGRETEKRYLINPGVPIPPESTEVHKITDAMVAGRPSFKDLAHQIAQDFANCDIAGFNSNHFDIPMLTEEMNKAGVDFDPSRVNFIDVQTIYHKKEKRDLEAACLFYCGHPMENHHSSMADAKTTLEVLKAQVEKYDDLENNVAALAKFSRYNRNVDLAGRIIYDDNGVEVFNFGKYKGKPVKEVLAKDPGYYGWIMNGDFAANAKQVLSRIRLASAPLTQK